MQMLITISSTALSVWNLNEVGLHYDTFSTHILVDLACYVQLQRARLINVNLIKTFKLKHRLGAKTNKSKIVEFLNKLFMDFLEKGDNNLIGYLLRL